jgi:DNA polymerase-1
MKKAIVIDGNSLIYRLFYATYKAQKMYAGKYPPTMTIKSSIVTILKLLNKEKYDFALVAFDAGKGTLRHNEFPEYKAGRSETPLELKEQMPIIKEVFNKLGLPIMEIEKIEADDIIGSYAKIMNKNEIAVEIYSSDKDMLQLVNDLTTVNLVKTGISNILQVTLKNFNAVYYGLSPQQVCDFKGISGDSSDNLCGVKGVGPITAAKLILEYGSLEKIYENIDKLNQTNKDKFEQSKQHAFMCKKLSTIDTSVLDSINIDKFILNKFDPDVLEELKRKYRIDIEI